MVRQISFMSISSTLNSSYQGGLLGRGTCNDQFLMSGYTLIFFCLAITIYLMETPFKAFPNRADPEQAAIVRAT